MTLELKIKIPGSNLSTSTELATMLTQAALAAARVAYNRNDPATNPLVDQDEDETRAREEPKGFETQHMA